MDGNNKSEDGFHDNSFAHFSKLLAEDSEVNQNVGTNADNNSNNAFDAMDVLEDFRINWRKELADNKESKSETNNINSEHLSKNVEMEAMRLFKKGVLLEQSGKLYDAVAFYRRATQLVPDIEFKMYTFEAQIQQIINNDEKVSNSFHQSDENHSNKDTLQNNNNNINNNDHLEEIDVNDCDLTTRFLRLNTDEFGNTLLCSPQTQTQTMKMHFSSLPFEVVLHILKWIISNELDLRSLEMFGSVCRGFYIASRDQELWRLSCYQTWGALSCSSLISHFGNNWRHMFVERVRPNFNGAYISRTTYIRQGEASFQDLHYRPCYLVEYYRYLRFFPDGHILMLTTSDDPYQSLPSLRHKKPKNSNVLTGVYHINGSTITAVMKRDYVSESASLSRKHKSNKSRDKSFSSQTFHISLEVRTVKKKRNCQLCWNYYSVHYKRANGQESVTSFELSPNLFPAFWFSRVKSYVSEAEYRLI